MNNLPKVEAVRYSIFIEELNKKIDYRPFTVKEHKLILEAAEKNDMVILSNVVSDVVEACTFKKLDMKTLPMHLVDFLYLQIHMKSVGVTNAAQYNCGHYIQDDEGVRPCGARFPVNIPLDRAVIKYPENFEKRRLVMVNDTVGIKLRVPTFEEYQSIDPNSDTLSIADQFIYGCIEMIFDGEKTYQPAVDFTKQELTDWLDNLDGRVVEKIGEFFNELPYLYLELPITCPNCKNTEVIKLRGIEDFFV